MTAIRDEFVGPQGVPLDEVVMIVESMKTADHQFFSPLSNRSGRQGPCALRSACATPSRSSPWSTHTEKPWEVRINAVDWVEDAPSPC